MWWHPLLGLDGLLIIKKKVRVTSWAPNLSLLGPIRVKRVREDLENGEFHLFVREEVRELVFFYLALRN